LQTQSRPSVAHAGATLFDRDYYRRYYVDGHTAVTSRAEVAARARLIASWADYVALPVRRLLDAGCGLGLLRAPLRRLLPQAQYTGLESSQYLCERYGWVHGTIESFCPRERFDLVICYDVMQYLDDLAARRALANLGRLCRGVLYFGALTRADWRANCDRRRTDSRVRLRTGRWYAQALRRQFRPIGAGLWIRRGAPLMVWELEAIGEVTASRRR
jgi:SAM-dependent methyltransferase